MGYDAISLLLDGHSVDDVIAALLEMKVKRLTGRAKHFWDDTPIKGMVRKLPSALAASVRKPKRKILRKTAMWAAAAAR
jgi:hypothetical protein